MIANTLDKNLREQIGYALHMERRKRGLRLKNVQTLTKIPMKVIDKIELGKCFPHSDLKKLLQFYKKNFKVELID